MVGVVLATHGRLAEELLRAAEQICGPVENCRAITLSATTALEEAREALAGAIGEVEQGQGVLVLTDMFGGTPSNLALTFIDERVEVVTGVNLPMMMKLTTARGPDVTVERLAPVIATQGQKTIVLASEQLRARRGPA
jgi:PTS system mannose-specific IIA component